MQTAGRATGSDASFALFRSFSFAPTGPVPLHYGEDENDVHSLN